MDTRGGRFKNSVHIYTNVKQEERKESFRKETRRNRWIEGEHEWERERERESERGVERDDGEGSKMRVDDDDSGPKSKNADPSDYRPERL